MASAQTATPVTRPAGGKTKFIIGGVLIAAAVIYLIWTSATANAQYFLTVDEVVAHGDQYIGRDLKVSGAVLGDTIVYDPSIPKLEFTVVNVPGSQKEIDAQGGMAEVLHQAVMDPSRTRLRVVYMDVRPDLLKNEAQAIMTGRLDESGVFHVSELLLKCPSRYEEALPEQSNS